MIWSKLSIGKKITISGCAMVTLCVAVTACVCFWQVHSDMVRQANNVLSGRMNVFWELLLTKDTNLAMSTDPLPQKIKQAAFRAEEDKLLIGFYGLNNDERVVDTIKHLFGGTATIFMKDVRVATNVKKADGSRAVGTKLTGPAYEAVIKQGKPYRGETEILGTSYYAAYDPIKNANGEVIGALYVGVPKADYFAPLYRLMAMIGAIALGLVLVVAAAILFSVRRAITPVVELVPTANRLAEGDLSSDIVVKRNDELGELQQALKGMVEKWRAVVRDVKAASDDVASAGHQLIATAERMSTGSGEQASRATQVATSAEEMSQTIMDIARNVNDIAQSATETASVAKDGEAVVGKSVAEVKEIARTVEESAVFVKSLGEKSTHIGEIVSVINDIADQTNLLALNAAIEAARAGEQGRGFAVVADEVRKLAERTAHATSEISSMIKSIQDEVFGAVDAMENATGKVNVGVELSGQAGEALVKIVRKVDDLQLMVQQIASASEEMSSTSEEITRDIEQIASISRETSATSEQTTEAATRLSGLAANLQRTVAGFTV